MFTGIVSGSGTVQRIIKNEDYITITVRAPKGFSKNLIKGSSIAVNGVCLTVKKGKTDNLEFDVIDETLDKILDLIKENKPDLLVCGHSHILKVSRDNKFNLLHINPGAAGNVGFHREKTIIRFDVNNEKIQNMQVVKLDK